MIFKHDAGRVIQCCVKFGTSEQRQKLFEQFKGKLIFLWGKFFSRFKKFTSLLEMYIILQKKINCCELEFKDFVLLCSLFFFLLISDDLGELIKSKYSKFLVKNFLNYG